MKRKCLAPEGGNCDSQAEYRILGGYEFSNRNFPVQKEYFTDKHGKWNAFPLKLLWILLCNSCMYKFNYAPVIF